MPVMAVSTFERFFRAAAGLDVDKNDIKRYDGFVNGELYDLLIRGQATAKANSRDIIEPWDLPVTKGLQESIHRFERMEEGIELQPIPESLAARPPLDVTYSEETQARLPPVAGGLSVALAQAFTLIDTEEKNPSSQHWERAFRIFDLLL